MSNTEKIGKRIKYRFDEIKTCEMCGTPTENHVILGQRLNKSQGLSPKSKTGISVSVIKCNNCNLIYSQPQPVPENMEDHYGTPPEDYWKESYFEWTPSYFDKQLKNAKELLPFKEGMTALDVGAGIGKCMMSMQKAGFDTYGFEPSTPFYERALSKMNIPTEKLKHGMVEDVEYPDATFDFITYGAVFEHLYHPAECLEKTFRWLKPNGIIHIEVPSSKHFIAKLVNIYFRLRGTGYVTNLSPMHSPFHLYEFGLESFQEAAKKMGFSIERYEYEVCTINFVPKFLHPLFRKYMEWTNSGMQLTVYLRKK